MRRQPVVLDLSGTGIESEVLVLPDPLDFGDVASERVQP
jgi:hypothetical protein